MLPHSLIQAVADPEFSKGGGGGQILELLLINVNLEASINWPSEVSPTLGCSIEISRDIYIYVSMSVVSKNA